MSIKLDGTNLWREWEAAKPLQDDQRRGLDDQLARYRGDQMHKLSTRAPTAALEPFEFEYMSKMYPRLAYDNPIYRGGTQNGNGEGEAIVPALVGAVNQIVIDTALRNEAILALLDFAFLPAAFRITMEPHMGRGEVDGAGPGGVGYGIPLRPVARRESPLRVRWDPLALNLMDCAWTGWESIHDRQTFIAWAKEHPEEGYDWKAIAEMGEDLGLEQVRGTHHTPSRDEFACVNIWVRDADISEMLKDIDPDDRHMFHGAICRIAIGGGKQDGNQAREICPPKPFFGPKCGPLRIGYAYPLFDKPGGFGALRPAKGTADALNRAVAAEDTRADRHRSFGLLDGTRRDIEKFKDAIDGSIHSMPGIDKNKFVAVEIGGPTELGQGMIALYRARLAQISAMAPSASGAVTGKGTATENIEASQTLDERMAFIGKQFYGLMNDVGWSLAWYAYHSQRVVQPLPDDVVKQMQGAVPPELKVAPGPDGQPIFYLEPVKSLNFYGGKRDGVPIEPDEFDRFQFTLDFSAMSWRSDESQQLLMQLVDQEIATNGAAMSNPMFSHVAWDEVQKAKEKAYGHPIFGKLFKLDVAAQLAQSQALMMEAQAQADRQQNGPKMGNDVGIKPETPKAPQTTNGRPKPVVNQRAAPPGEAAKPKQPAPGAANPKVSM